MSTKSLAQLTHNDDVHTSTISTGTSFWCLRHGWRVTLRGYEAYLMYICKTA